MARPPGGGLSGHGEIAPSLLRELLAYVTCPKCRRTIREPFSRASGPVPYVHRASNSYCRLIIHPDPVGEAHGAIVLAEDVSLEVGFARYVLQLRKVA